MHNRSQPEPSPESEHGSVREIIEETHKGPIAQHGAREVECNHQTLSDLAFTLASCRIMSEAFSPIITQAALMLPETTVGMIEASATRRPSTPWTRKRSSTTAAKSEPMRQ